MLLLLPYSPMGHDSERDCCPRKSIASLRPKLNLEVSDTGMRTHGIADVRDCAPTFQGSRLPFAPKVTPALSGTVGRHLIPSTQAAHRLDVEEVDQGGDQYTLACAAYCASGLCGLIGAYRPHKPTTAQIAGFVLWIHAPDVAVSESLNYYRVELTCSIQPF